MGAEIDFIVGAIFGIVVTAIVSCSIFLERESKAYDHGYSDGINSVR